MTHESSPCIGIGLCTYKRAEGLRAALRALSKLGAPRATRLKLCVGDSDPARSARQLVASSSLTFPYPLLYEAAPEGCLPTRNALLDRLLSEGVAYIAFCDDDAEVDADWLEVLYEALKQNEVEVVTDYVRVRMLDNRSPAWIKLSGEKLLYIRPLPSPRLVSFARSGNVLFRASVAETLRFDTRWKGHGGDTYFFLQAHLRGARILAIAAYKITESWPLERASFRFLCRRHYLIGLMSSLIYREAYGWRGVAKSLWMGAKKIAYAPFHLLWMGIRGMDGSEKYLIRLSFAQFVLLWVRSLGHFVGLFRRQVP